MALPDNYVHITGQLVRTFSKRFLMDKRPTSSRVNI